MNRTAERGKTLIVDGPASINVNSGKVEVFGFSPSSTARIVVREGKRLPLHVKDTAAFDISLGANAGAEEVAGDTIPSSWAKAYEELAGLRMNPVVVMIIGTADSGKTSFCTYFVNRLLLDKKKVAILDGDVGQSDVGPPCTIAYAFVTKYTTDLFNLYAKNAAFVGSTSPDGVVDEAVNGFLAMKNEIACDSPDFIIVNTDGWTEGEEAIAYKTRIAQELKPDIVFGLQQKDELAPLLQSLSSFRSITVESPESIRQRSPEKRKNLRELAYLKYLKNARVQSFQLGWLKIDDGGVFGLNQTHPDAREAGKIYELLGMKPLHYAERPDHISIIIGRRRWISNDSLKKVEEFTGKKVSLIKKGDEEGLLLALYNGEEKFLGIGVLQEIDYLKRSIKILTPVTSEIASAKIGCLKLDKNMKEVPAFVEDRLNPGQFSYHS